MYAIKILLNTSIDREYTVDSSNTSTAVPGNDQGEYNITVFIDQRDTFLF